MTPARVVDRQYPELEALFSFKHQIAQIVADILPSLLSKNSCIIQSLVYIEISTMLLDHMSRWQQQHIKLCKLIKTEPIVSMDLPIRSRLHPFHLWWLLLIDDIMKCVLKRATTSTNEMQACTHVSRPSKPRRSLQNLHATTKTVWGKFCSRAISGY